MTEKKLLTALKSGASDAYTNLFSEYYNWLCNYIFGLCNDRMLAEDIVQETMIVFWEKQNHIVITTSLKNYLFRSCYNQFLQHIRKNKIPIDLLDQIRWDVLSNIRTEEIYDEHKMVKIDVLHSLIHELPPKCKEIFLLNKFEKKKYKEIAADMKISIKTVEGHMSKALHYLKKNADSFI